MNELRCLPIPGGGTVGWAHTGWLLGILPSDSWRKRAIRSLARLRLLNLLSRRFDGRLNLSGQEFLLDDVLEHLDVAANPALPMAIFANVQRDPPRIYVWLQSGIKNFFLKIGTEQDYPAFRNEVEVSANLKVHSDIVVMRPIANQRKNGLSMLVFEGIESEILARKKRMSPHEIIWFLRGRRALRKGVFGGAVHCDLASNNLFKVGDKLLIVDWEFSALSGPDYCDLVGLIVAILADEPGTMASVETTRYLLAREAGCQLSENAVSCCLRFLAARGNRQAAQVLDSV